MACEHARRTPPAGSSSSSQSAHDKLHVGKGDSSSSDSDNDERPRPSAPPVPAAEVKPSFSDSAAAAAAEAKAQVSRLFGREQPIHKALGGGKLLTMDMEGNVSFFSGVASPQTIVHSASATL